MSSSSMISSTEIYYLIVSVAITVVVTILATRLISRLGHFINQPIKTKIRLEDINEAMLKGLAEVNQKVDKLSEEFKKDAKVDSQSRRVLFSVQDLQFSVMSHQTGAIRELAKSVCNGNKESALHLCDEADKANAEGKSLQKDYLMEKA